MGAGSVLILANTARSVNVRTAWRRCGDLMEIGAEHTLPTSCFGIGHTRCGCHLGSVTSSSTASQGIAAEEFSSMPPPRFKRSSPRGSCQRGPGHASWPGNSNDNDTTASAGALAAGPGSLGSQNPQSLRYRNTDLLATRLFSYLTQAPGSVRHSGEMRLGGGTQWRHRWQAERESFPGEGPRR